MVEERARVEEGTGMTDGIGEEEEEELREKESFIDTGVIEELAEREEVRKRRLRDSEEMKELSRWIEIKEEKSEMRKRFGKNMPLHVIINPKDFPTMGEEEWKEHIGKYRAYKGQKPFEEISLITILDKESTQETWTHINSFSQYFLAGGSLRG